jgi:hypothetical protein
MLNRAMTQRELGCTTKDLQFTGLEEDSVNPSKISCLVKRLSLLKYGQFLKFIQVKTCLTLHH